VGDPCRQLRQRIKSNNAASYQFLFKLWLSNPPQPNVKLQVLLGVVGASLGLIYMCQCYRPRLPLGDLPEGGAIKVQEFAHAALGAPNLAVYLVGGHIDKTPRDFDRGEIASFTCIKAAIAPEEDVHH
jgi:hypothetical protein